MDDLASMNPEAGPGIRRGSARMDALTGPGTRQSGGPLQVQKVRISMLKSLWPTGIVVFSISEAAGENVDMAMDPWTAVELIVGE